MKCYAQFNYGPGYANPEADDYEEFLSMSAVEEAVESRSNNNPCFPCVDQEYVEARIFLGEPTGMFPCDTYPDFRVFFGSRGGVRRVRC